MENQSSLSKSFENTSTNYQKNKNTANRNILYLCIMNDNNKIQIPVINHLVCLYVRYYLPLSHRVMPFNTKCGYHKNQNA